MSGERNIRQWTVKTLPAEVVDLARASAKAQGKTLGGWLEEAIREAAKTPEDKAQAFFVTVARLQRLAFDAYLEAGFSETQALQLTSNSALLSLSQI